MLEIFHIQCNDLKSRVGQEASRKSMYNKKLFHHFIQLINNFLLEKTNVRCNPLPSNSVWLRAVLSFARICLQICVTLEPRIHYVEILSHPVLVTTDGIQGVIQRVHNIIQLLPLAFDECLQVSSFRFGV